MSACTQTGCGGTILGDGYCDTCGFAAATPAAASTPAAHQHVAAPAAAGGARGINVSAAGSVCTEAGCGGTVLADGYCNTCGMAAKSPAAVATPAVTSPGSTASTGTPVPVTAASMALPTEPRLSQVVSGSGASTEARRSAATRRLAGGKGTRLGVGLVTVAPTPVGDPSKALMSAEKIQSVLDEVPEPERFCKHCDSEVGRGRDGRPGRPKGFCGTCRTPFDFVTNAPVLKPGDLIANQYEILGPLAHGGMGWIYLGKDTAVSNRWVVLKGLLNENDADAIASAVAERQFLAQIEHGNIVNIYNFVTWAGAGYIVMEYVGGESLNSKLKRQRTEQSNVHARLPLGDAIAYVLAVLPAIGYLHDQGLVYNDLKPANIMATANDVKLIDVGGVMQRDDQQAAIFGTQGFQAPEVASAGPSVPSDLYTVGRTLAVLTLPFVFHQGDWLHRIPPASDQPLLAHWESFHRFLLKSTAPHPDDRFQTATEMRNQLVGVLREVVAVSSGTPQPVPSALFSGDRLTDLLVDDNTAADKPDWHSLPHPRIIGSDPAASFLFGLPDDDPGQAAALLRSAIDSQQVPWTHETAFMTALLTFEHGGDPGPMLTNITKVDPWDWRINWIRGLAELRVNKPAQAAELFSQVWTQLPGEIAPKLAVALSAEMTGEYARAVGLYDSIVTTDPTYVTASFGLARCRAASADRTGAVAAYQRVPASSAGYYDARVAAARTWVSSMQGSQPDADDIVAAVQTLEGIQLDAEERADISLEIVEQALAGLESGSITPSKTTQVLGNQLTAEGMRNRLEQSYRELARLAQSPADRVRLIDRANEVRQVSLW